MSAVQPVKPVADVAKSAAKPPEPAKLSAAEIARQVRRERARRLARNLTLWVGLPTLLAVVYYGFIAKPQYESVTTLVVRGSESDAALFATAFREYGLSQDMLTELDGAVQLSKHYQNSGDFLSGLPRGAGSETRYAFFRKQVDARYDAHSRVLSLHARAFSGKQAQALGQAIVERATRFVSELDATAVAPFIVAQKPSLPSEAKLPRRMYGIITVLLASLALFAIGSLLIAAVREHAQF
jgi:capsule polysaccharide export protein KpsE/RkpR